MNANPILEPAGLVPRNEQTFLKIASYSTALALGFAAGSLESLYMTAAGGFAFHISGGTVAAFVLGAAVGLIYWKIVSLHAARSSLLTRLASGGLLLVGAGAFAYPMRFLPKERLSEALQSLATTVVALSLVGLMLWRVRNFLEEDARQNGD